jgi:predicted ATPase
MGQWRGALRDAVGPNGQLIVNLIPELEFILGKQPPVPDPPPREAQNRFQLVFRRFLGAFAGRSTRSRCSSMICNGWMQQRSIS